MRRRMERQWESFLWQKQIDLLVYDHARAYISTSDEEHILWESEYTCVQISMCAVISEWVGKDKQTVNGCLLRLWIWTLKQTQYCFLTLGKNITFPHLHFLFRPVQGFRINHFRETMLDFLTPIVLVPQGFLSGIEAIKLQSIRSGRGETPPPPSVPCYHLISGRSCSKAG